MPAIQIDQQTFAQILKLGGQYFLPVAALLRAIYSGMRGKFPEGFAQIAAASAFAGVTALADNKALDIKTIILEVMGNTVFMAGLLSFIMVYLLKQPNRGLWFDGIVGGVIGLLAFAAWTVILGNEWPWWLFPVAIAVGSGGFIALRFLLRQIIRMVRIATYCIVIGAFLVLGAGAVMLGQTVFNYIQSTPTVQVTPAP